MGLFARLFFSSNDKAKHIKMDLTGYGVPTWFGKYFGRDCSVVLWLLKRTGKILGCCHCYGCGRYSLDRAFHELKIPAFEKTYHRDPNSAAARPDAWAILYVQFLWRRVWGLLLPLGAWVSRPVVCYRRMLCCHRYFSQFSVEHQPLAR